MRDLAASNIAQKDAIAKSINDAGDEAAQDRALRRAMNSYAGVRGLLAPLRRTELAINYVEPYKTKDEIAEAAMNNPGSLELKELLYAAANTEEDAHKLMIYKAVFDKYPKCWISKNNAAVIYMKEGKVDEAGKLLNEAIEMYPDQETLNSNMGALAFHNGDYAKAAEYFEKAGELDSYNKGMLALASGDYEDAAQLLNGACDYNTGLAQLLAGDYQKAEATLSCTEEAPCQAAYLVAVIGARTGDANKVFTNLKKAFDLNPALKKQAMYDREFQKYRNADQFKALVK
jgi:tetratricopeptide (TPR) repeat protein